MPSVPVSAGPPRKGLMRASAPRVDARFRCEVVPERERVRVVPVGDLDLGTAPELRGTVRELLDAGFEDLVLDLRELTFMDSSGLRLVLDLDAEAHADAWRLALIAGRLEVQRVFELTGTAGLLPFCAAAAPGR